MTPHVNLAALDRDIARVDVLRALDDLDPAGRVIRCSGCGVATFIPSCGVGWYGDVERAVVTHDALERKARMRHGRCRGAIR